MKLEGAVPLIQMSVVSGVSIGSQGTTSVNKDASTSLSFIPSIQCVLVERKKHPTTLVPLSNVRYMRVDEDAAPAQPSHPQVKR